MEDLKQKEQGIQYKKGDFHYNYTRTFKVSTNYQADHETNSFYPSNFVKTSYYNALNYFPLALLKQFKRNANIYFLIIAIIQSIPSISPLSAYVAIAPLVVVLGISVAREGIEDWERHKSDEFLNSTLCTVMKDQNEQQVKWKDVHVGDILKVKVDEAFPADLICLGSAFVQGNCYIETGALDGEKNLKPKGSLNETKTLFGSDKIDQKIILDMTAQPPSQELYQFEGSMVFKSGINQDFLNKTLSLNAKQLLLRGAFLRNTEYIYGVVIYTGLDTKIMKNADPSKTKFSDVEKNMNKYITIILCFQLILCILMSILNGVWNAKETNHWYLNYPHSATGSGGLNFFSYFILLNTMIPISLIVSLELVKMAQAYFISNDKDMYIKSKDKYPQVMTSTINEELGQVEYVFSDKTGTLTCNVMQFKFAVIGDKRYGKEEEDIFEAANTSVHDRVSVLSLKQNHQIMNKLDQNSSPEHKKEKDMSEFVFKDEELDELLSFHDQHQQKLVNQKSHKINNQVGIKFLSNDKTTSYEIKNQFDLASEYFTLFATTHDCLVSRNKNEPDQTNLKKSLKYGGPSPDEITLVEAAKMMGFIYLGTQGQDLELQIFNKKKTVTLLNSFEFDSARKRMSIIIYDKENNVYKMYMKGADNIMKQRFHKNHQPFLTKTELLLTEFSVKGLRTLMMGMKILSQKEYLDFKDTYNNLANSAQREKDQNLLADSIEQDFTLIGASAVEDKLQDNVPETIADLIRAIWMLTGDKLETAENIARSCKLIQEGMGVIQIDNKNQEDLKKRMVEAEKEFQNLLNQKKKKSVLVEGEALAIILQHENLTQSFVEIAKQCESVVCCRVTPKQKASVVKLIKDREKKITLAIGDGANDVNMIQEAHIGCGIFGNEGMRAVQASDFAFGEFQCLWRLILVHGRWSYIRIAEMIVYFFYKNMVFTIPQFYFAFYCGYSGQTIFDDYYITLYNLCFTALPLMARGVFEQDLNYKSNKQLTNIDEGLIKQANQAKMMGPTREEYVKDKYPYLYTIGQGKRMFSQKRFLIWAFQGIVHGLIIFFVCVITLSYHHIFRIDGHENDLWSLSLAIFSALILQVDLKLAIYTQYWTVFHYFSLFVTSILLFFLFMLGTTAIESSKVYETPLVMLSGSSYYFAVFLSLGILFIFDYLIFVINRNFRDLFLNKLPFENLLLRQFLQEDNQNQTLDLNKYSIFEEYQQMMESVKQKKLLYQRSRKSLNYSQNQSKQTNAEQLKNRQMSLFPIKELSQEIIKKNDINNVNQSKVNYNNNIINQKDIELNIIQEEKQENEPQNQQNKNNNQKNDQNEQNIVSNINNNNNVQKKPTLINFDDEEDEKQSLKEIDIQVNKSNNNQKKEIQQQNSNVLKQ